MQPIAVAVIPTIRSCESGLNAFMRAFRVTVIGELPVSWNGGAREPMRNAFVA